MAASGKVTLDELRNMVDKHPKMSLVDMDWFENYDIEGFLAELPGGKMVEEMSNGSTLVFHEPVVRIWIEDGIAKVVEFDQFGCDEDDAPGGDMGKPVEIWSWPTDKTNFFFKTVIQLLVEQDEQNCCDRLKKREKQLREEQKELEEDMKFHKKYRSQLLALSTSEEVT